MSPLVTLLLFSAAVMAILPLERLWPARTGQPPERAATTTAVLLSPLAQLALLNLSVFETALINAGGGGLVDLRALPFWLGLPIYLVAADFGEYLYHRAQHAIPWLWEMHSLHHSDRALHAASAMRHFWMEPFLKSVTIWLAVALLFRADGAILTAYALIGFWNLVTHANLRFGFGPLSWMWNSPQYHRLHHGVDPRHHNANFAALLPIFDVLSGAYHRPARGEYPATGLDGVAATPVEVLVWPVRHRLKTTMMSSGT